ncbi:hypothetical protein PYW07_007530 [Mythimna separata]|uniref:Uncharacterized protein n=1 Tax=Mythimna separata TaxID=271217 RepID=A0AAD7Y9Q9_MYTSE|nr:hypothetical protein PYW07_011460 [Mythimna separata]KAJ8716730.1 hypothetical protein PYW07_003357 [Mythimna separata]KAJ8735910.1 hypothetical protein PYW07_007530 [Mythimna separata]
MISIRDQFRKCFKRAQSLLLQEVINEVDKELKKKERIWVRNWISERDQKGGSVLLLQQLKVEDPNEYRLALRMTAENFEELLSLVSINIQRKNTLFRDAISAKLKLEVTQFRLQITSSPLLNPFSLQKKSAKTTNTCVPRQHWNSTGLAVYIIPVALDWSHWIQK